MNSRQDPLALPVIKQEFDDDLISSVEGWSPLTGNITTNSSLPLSTTTTQFGENPFSPTATTSNDSTTTTTTPLPNLITTYPGVASVHKRPKIDHQVKILEGSNNRPFFTNRNKYVPNDSTLQNSNTDLLLNLELQLKQTQEQLKELTVESRNANEIHEKKYVELKLDYFEFKTNANIKWNKLQIENDKLHHELNQLKNHHQTCIDQINAQTPLDTQNQSQLNSIHQQNVHTTIDNFLTTSPVNSTSTVQIKQEIIDDESTCSEPIQVEQNIDSGSSSLLLNVPSLLEKVSENILQTENSSGNLDVSNLSNSNDQHVMSLASLTDQNVTEFQYIKQEFSDDDSLANNNDKFTVDDISTNTNLSSDVNMYEVMTHESELVDENEDNLNQYFDDDEMSYSANDNNSVAKSINPSSALRQSNQIASKYQNLPKRKQSQPNNTEKKSKKTIEDDEDDELNDGNEEVNQIDNKIKVLNLDCTQQNCKIKLNTLKHLNDHLSSAHELLPFRCFAQNCNLRFDNKRYMAAHIKFHHTNSNSKFVCPVCRKEFTSQQRTYIHWNQNHLSGQFQCNLNECNLVYDTRAKVNSHQNYKHCPESKLLACQHDGCSAAFSKKINFDDHQLVHLNNKPFNCKWSQCRHRTNRRADLVIHIRMRHFSLPRTVKEQKAKNIVEQRDPNDYIRVVEDEIAE